MVVTLTVSLQLYLKSICIFNLNSKIIAEYLILLEKNVGLVERLGK